MKFFAQLFGVQKQEMRAKRQLKRFPRKSDGRKLRIHVATLALPRLVVIQKILHRLHPNPPQLLHRRNRFPHKLLTILSRLSQHLVIRCCDPLPNPIDIQSIQRVDGGHRTPASRRFRVKTRRPIRTPQYPQPEIRITERKHLSVLLKRSPPRHHSLKFEHRHSQRHRASIPRNTRLPRTRPNMIENPRLPQLRSSQHSEEP